MMKTKKIAGLALAAMVGFATLGSAAQAAPFATVGGTSAGVASGIETVRDRGDRRGGHRDRRYRDRRYRGRHPRRHGFRHWYPPRHCYWKRIRVYDAFTDSFYFKERRFCR